MPTLKIDLQDGFEREPVTVRVNGKPVLTRPDVRTSPLTGLAGSVTVEVAAGPVDIEVELPKRGLERKLNLQVKADTYLGISRSEKGIDHIVRMEPFGYA